MKKLISLVLALAMIACVAAGCAPTTNNNDDANNTPVVKNYEGTMEQLLVAITTEEPAEIMGGMAMALDLSAENADLEWQIQSYTGLENANDLSDVAIYESMVGSIAFSLVAVRVNEGVDAQTVGQAMKDGINPRKWICVGADELIVAGFGDVVFLAMLDSGLNMSAQSYVDAFKTVVGADLSFTLN